MNRSVILIIKFSFITLFISSVNCKRLLALNYPDSLVSVKYFDKSVNFLKDNILDSAEIYKNKSLEIFHQNNDLNSWTNVYRKFGQIYRDDLNDLTKSIENYGHPIIYKFRDPIKDDEWSNIAWSTFFAGYTCNQKGDLKKSLEFYQKTKTIFVDILNNENDTITHYVYVPMGNIYTRFGDYEKAKYYLKKAEEESLNAGKNNWAAQARQDYAVIYQSMSSHEEAINLLNEALAWEGISKIEIYFIKSLLSESYIELRHLGEALKTNKEAHKSLIFSIKNNLYTNAERYLPSIYENYASIYQLNGELSLAKENLLKALELSENYYRTTNRRELGKINNRIATVLLEDKEIDSAIIYVQKALNAVLPSLPFDKIHELPDPEFIYAENTILEALTIKANIYEQLANQNQDHNYLNNAVQCYELTFIVDRKLMETYEYVSSNIEIIKEARGRYGRMIMNLIKLYELTGDQNNLTRAHELGEQSKSLLIRESIQNIDAVAISGIPNNIIEKLSVYKNEIVTLEQLRFEMATNNADKHESNVSSLNDRLFSLYERKKALLNQIEKEYPTYYKLKYKTNVATLKKTNATLKFNQSLIEYFIHDTTAFIFLISPKYENIKIKKISWNPELSFIAQSIKEDIYRSENQAYIRKASTLYKQLIEPISEFIQDADHLIIVPDGVLWNVPFDALLTEVIPEQENYNFKSLPYLIRDKKISYAFSATLLQDMKKPIEEIDEKKIFSFSPSFHEIGDENESYAYQERNMLGPLKYNIPEAKAISKIIGGLNISDKKATIEEFLSAWKNGRILHIATHAKANLKEPNLSYIAFSNTIDTLETPYKLYVNQLYNQTTPLEMVVLSACETGTGPVWKGEGMISIARAFAFSGTRSIITTLWNINDEATKDIMVNFYSNLKKGDSKDEALQLAKLDYINSDNTRIAKAHPKYWAAFTAIGNMGQVEFGLSFYENIYIISAGGIMGLLIGWFLWAYFQKKLQHRS